MIVVIPVCKKDEALVLKNLDWLAELDGKIDGETVISCPEEFEQSKVVEKISAVFPRDRIHTIRYPEWGGNPKWPHPQNWAWQSTARAISYTGQPWLWWEADSTPIIKGWLDAIKSEYAQGRKPFMGCIMDHNGSVPHMTGVGVYPHNVHEFSTSAMLCRAAPFDIVMARDTLDKTHRANHLIQHHVRVNGDSTDFPDRASVQSIVQSGVVLFHRCKNGSLIDRLREDKPLGKLKSFFSKPWIAPPKKKQFPMIAHIDSSSGYGQFSTNIALEMKRRGFEVELYPPSMNEIHGKLPIGIKEMVRTTQSPHDWAFVVFPSVVQPARLVMHVDRIAYLTMFESTRLTDQARGVMNRCKVVLNPSQWGLSCFSAYGIDAPLRLAPLGLDMAKWPVKKQKIGNEFVFGTAGKTASGGIRKGFNVVVEAFRKAFPREMGVKLRVKCFPEDTPINVEGDTRIDLVTDYLEHDAFVEWVHSINVFVSGSACEGWGLIQQQSMATGRPVISVNFGAVQEFMNESNGFFVDWKLIEGEGIYEGKGHYAKPSVESMAEQMLYCFNHPKEVIQKSELSAISARRFTLENSAGKILEVLAEFGFPV